MLLQIFQRLFALGLAALATGAAFGVLRLVDHAGGRELLLPLVPLAGMGLLGLTSAAFSGMGLRRKWPAATTR